MKEAGTQGRARAEESALDGAEMREGFEHVDELKFSVL